MSPDSSTLPLVSTEPVTKAGSYSGAEQALVLFFLLKMRKNVRAKGRKWKEILGEKGGRETVKKSLRAGG